ncbi:hypothetical protein ACIQI7_04935 [Kitasatospora sp. NPDC092039]|uniref:hypothetical protein n=1 Tax=Kitasatospora sp. NPDC092039 TaxID=3364086 RepID=UPI003822D48C
MPVRTAPTKGPWEAPAVFPLGLAAITHRRFPPGSARIDDAFSRRHFADLTAAYGVDHRPDLVQDAAGNTFAAMAGELLAGLGPSDPSAPRDARGTPVDLAVVAHATPDLDCRLAAVTALSELVPGGPLSFTVSECGSNAPFAALRLAAAYARRHGHRRVALFVLDQATFPYESGRELAGDAGLALLLTDTGSLGRLTLWQRTGTGPDDVAAAVRTALADLDATGCPVVAGAAVDPARDLPGHPGRIVRTPPGHPASGALTALAADPAWSAGREQRIVVVDHEPDTGDLAVCLIERGGR